jgi:hypothetical protein
LVFLKLQGEQGFRMATGKNFTRSPKGSWFEQNPVKAWFCIFFGLLLLIELTLRAVDPELIHFYYDSRQIYQYHPRWLIDLKPDSIAHLRLSYPPFNFLVTINKYGFRTYDRPIDYYTDGDPTTINSEPDIKIVHVTGDSFAMGWGNEYTASFPAILEWITGRHYRVLDLGSNGYGAIAATEKSMALWRVFPAHYAVYFYFDNAPGIDHQVILNEKRSRLYHWLKESSFFLRRHTYIGAIPFILQYYMMFQHTKSQTNLETEQKAWSPDDLTYQKYIVSEPMDTNVPSSEKYQFSIDALESYRKFVEARGAKLFVIVLESESSRKFASLIRKRGFNVTLIRMSSKGIMVQEGHFNYFGNYIVANIVRNLIERDRETFKTRN